MDTEIISDLTQSQREILAAKFPNSSAILSQSRITRDNRPDWNELAYNSEKFFPELAVLIRRDIHIFDVTDRIAKQRLRAGSI